MNSAHPWIRTRLSIMMFLEFFLWASWLAPIGGYMTKTLHLTGSQVGWVFSATALAAIISPLFVGFIADRLFATERVLCVLHLIGGTCLCLSATQMNFPGLMTAMMANALCFMPTLALGNSLAFRNIPDPDKFPRIAVLGTIGWIVSGWIVGLVLGGTQNTFFYLAGGTAFVQAVYCLTLPHTPPKGRDQSGGDVLGLGALRLLKEPSFLTFVLCAFLIAIPSTFYFVAVNPFLEETERPVPTTLMTLAQFSEIFVMFTMPFFIGRLGLRTILLLGMAAWAIRYALFATLSFPLVLVGLLVHGFCYCFVFVGAYIYVDKRAPRDFRASAQSFIAFLMLGVGWFLGSQLAGYAMDQYPALAATMSATDKDGKVVDDAPLPRWSPEATEAEEGDIGKLLDKDGNGRIAPEELKSIPDDGLKSANYTYAKKDLLNVLQVIQQGVDREQATKKGAAKEPGIARADWVAAQAHQWPLFWWWPAGAAAIIAVVFFLGPRGKEVASADAPEEPAAKSE
jgi:nucleoside transporter